MVMKIGFSLPKLIEIEKNNRHYSQQINKVVSYEKSQRAFRSASRLGL
jgi:hypothetical protein